MKKVGVVGTGIMGKGISQLLLSRGFEVISKSRNEKMLDGVKTTTNFGDLASADFVIEAVSEDFEVKKEVFRELSRVCRKDAVIVSNTSSISIDELAKEVDNPGRFGGMHFFNPVSRMELVEVVRGKKTSGDTVKQICELAHALGKTPIVVMDSPGFIVNRLLMPFMNDAALLVERGVASPEDIDNAVKLGLNHPMGPLRLLDLIGLDVFLNSMKNMGKTPTQLVKKMVSEGKLGRKSGEGFYKY
jgi:3-hydroxybutyryl-CoA dehydrogenase